MTISRYLSQNGIIALLLILFISDGCRIKHSEPIPVQNPTVQHGENKTDSNSTITQPVDKPTFISAKQINYFTKDQFKLLATVGGYGSVADKIINGAFSYYIEYKTTYQGKEIIASGLLHIPDELTKEPPMLSIQHGTTFLKSEAPSRKGNVSPTPLLASCGYITIEPDFIGYGASANVMHPYYVKGITASSIIDFISASKEFLTLEKKEVGNRLFLAGYSEGGYATMATFEELDKNRSGKYNIAAVAAGAGGYDLKQMLSGITQTETYTYPAYPAFLITGYDSTYSWKKGSSFYFASPYAEKIPHLVNGTNGGSKINSDLTSNIKDLMNPTFYTSLKSNESSQFKDAIALNSISGWNSKVPLRLYHGTNDEIIPYKNTTTVFEAFRNAGTQVELVTIPGGQHGSSFEPMLFNLIEWFNTIK